MKMKTTATLASLSLLSAPLFAAPPEQPSMRPALPSAAASAFAGAQSGQITVQARQAGPTSGPDEDFHGAAISGGVSASDVSWTAVDTIDATAALERPSGPQTFLGVAVSPIPAEISRHLSIQSGTGLLVNHIDKDSPAAKAGIQDGDILAKLDDQILILPQQLSVLVAGKKEGETIKLTYLRKGEPQEANATLVTKDFGPAQAGTFRIGNANVVIDGGQNGPIRTFTRTFGPKPEELDPKSRQLFEKMRAMHIKPGTPTPDAAEPADLELQRKQLEARMMELIEQMKKLDR